MSSGTNGGAPVRFKSGGENAGWVGESEVVGRCRTEEIEGDSRCGFGDTKDDGAPTSGGTTAAGNSYHSVQKDKNSSTSHLYRVSNTRTYLNAMTVASWACRSGFSLEIPRCRPTLQGEIARSPPQVARLQRALQALRCVLVPPGLGVGAPSCALPLPLLRTRVRRRVDRRHHASQWRSFFHCNVLDRYCFHRLRSLRNYLHFLLVLPPRLERVNDSRTLSNGAGSPGVLLRTSFPFLTLSLISVAGHRRGRRRIQHSVFHVSCVLVPALEFLYETRLRRSRSFRERRTNAQPNSKKQKKERKKNGDQLEQVSPGESAG